MGARLPKDVSQDGPGPSEGSGATPGVQLGTIRMLGGHGKAEVPLRSRPEEGYPDTASPTQP